jgi:hypothetical protein
MPNPFTSLTCSEHGEAVAVFKECKSVGLTLTEAVRFAVRHRKPPAETISLTKAIKLALRAKPPPTQANAAMAERQARGRC